MANSIKEALFELTDYSDWDLIGITQEQADALAVQLEESRQEALLEIKRIIEEAKPHSRMGWNTERQHGYDLAVRDYHNNLLKALSSSGKE